MNLSAGIPISRRRTLGSTAAVLATTLANWAGSDANAAAASDLWSKLGAATWIADGAQSAKRTVYAITDPNCIWCHRFWEATRPWVDAGKVQVRYLLVGIIRDDSARKAATILSAPNPAAAFEQNERNFGNGGIFPSAAVSPAIQAALEGNTRLMNHLGFRGTPALLYQSKQGAVEKVAGFPTEELLAKVMGDL